MMLRARVALHLGQRRPEPDAGWAPAVLVDERVQAAEPVARPIAAAVPTSTEPVARPIAPAVPTITAPDTSRVRGEAYAHGVYRLFVRGTPRRTGPREVTAVALAPAQREVTREVARAPVAAPAQREVTREVARAPVAAPAQREVTREVARAPVAAPAQREVTREVARAPVAAPAQREVTREVARAPVAAPAQREVTREVARAPALREGTAASVAPVDRGMAFGPDLGGFVRRVVDWPLVPGARPALLGGALARLGLPDAGRMRALLPRLLAGAAPGPGGSPVVFLDVETTALDRGAGALAFMVGIAALVDGALRVEQWILTRLSAESAMLAEVLARVVALAGPGATLGSFNGASFDVPLLRTRLRRAGLPTTSLERAHLDLLPLARRMWRGRGPDCRLVTLERTQLGVRRVHDIEGHEIPAVFWAWLRNPADPEVQAVMGRVADHNLADLVTLPALGAAIGACIEAPGDLDMAVRAAEHSLSAGRSDEALALLGDWLGRAAAPAQRRRALLLAADLLRRDEASRGRAAELWAEVCRICPGDPAAHEALAKHLEHHTGELGRALEVARGSVAPCPRRVARLRRKLAGSRSAPGPLRIGAQAC
jgi:hypothetical protein